MTRSLLITACACLALFACTKEPGEGGQAEIRGRIFVQEINEFTGQPTGVEYYEPEYRVYLVYGSNDHFDDDTRTGPNGEFRFSWLRKGDYKVFVYSDCDPTVCPSGVEQVIRTVSINGRKDVVEVPTITVEKW